MAVRIADYIYSGDLRNTSRNRVFGWIEFAPDYGIFLELAGNFAGSLAGKHIRFRRSSDAGQVQFQPGSFPEFIEKLANRQIGVVETFEVRRKKVPTIPIAEFESLAPDKQDEHLIEKEFLFLEWFSQNGRVVSEIINADWEFVDDEQENQGKQPPGQELLLGSGVAGDPFDDEDGPDLMIEMYGIDDDDVEEDDDDPYGLFDPELQNAVEQSVDDVAPEFTNAEFAIDFSDDKPPRSWDDVIPGIDPETKQMYEQWDEIFAGKKDEPISYLFPKAMQLPKPEQVTSEEEAELLVKSILAQLALLSVAVDICEHFTMLDTYRLLVEQLLPEAKVHPNLAASEMVQHYTTSEYCTLCDAELYDDEADEDGDDDDDDDS